MKRTLFFDANCDLWLSDHSVNAETVAKKMQDVSLFNTVRYRKTKKITYSQSRLQDVKDVITYNFCGAPMYDLYDEIIFYNLELELYSMADFYRKVGHSVKWSRYEEGILSYNTDFEAGMRITATRKIRKITHRSDVALEVDTYYCSFPELKTTHMGWKFIRIAGIDKEDGKLQDTLKYVFDYTPVDNQQKFIFFASSSDIDGKPFGETELVFKIADVVGSKNLLVKMHPRDTRTVYKDNGIAVMENSFTPWEVMQFDNLSKDKVLLTINSGAFLSISALINQSTRGIFLYNYAGCNTESFIKRSDQIEATINGLHNLGKCKSIFVAKPDELAKILSIK